MTNPSLILPQSPAFAENNVYAARVEDGVVPLYNVLPLTFTRASNGTRVNKDGLIENMPYNLLQQSNTFNTTWTINGTGTLTSGQGGYDETNNAWRFDKSASSTYLSQPSTSLGINTFSIYAKAGTNTHIAFWIRNANQGKFFDLANGMVGSDFIGTPIDAQIQSMGNGWYRCSIVVNGADNNCRIYPADADGDVSGTSGNIYIQDAQLVEGSTAKPYLATTDRLDMPRITYPIGGGCGSLLLEPQRTNLVTYSEDFSNVIWISTNTSKTSNTATSPDGTQNADLISADGVNNSHVVYQNASVTSGTSYALSCFIKKGTNDYAQVVGGTTAFGSNVWANFDLNTGVVGSVGSSATASIQDMGNGWYRCVVIGAATSTGSYPAIIVAIVPSSTSTRTEASTLTTNILVWGAQLEASSTYATSYIPTTSAAATRIADLGSNDVFGSTYTLDADFCLFQDFECFDFNNFAVFWSGGNYLSGGDFRSYMITYSNANIVLFGVNEVITAQLTTFTFSTNTRYKVAVRRVGSTINWFINGTKYSNTTGTTTTTVKIRSISGASLGGQNVMKLNEAIIFEDKTLTDSECITLTTL